MRTPHGIVETPAFMPVGTQGAVKAVTHRDLDALGVEIMLSNTYHLYLRPGADRIARLGGLHKFIGWSKPILTDSGGYQVFSLAARRKVHEDGVTFRSHLDGSEHLLTPESAVEVQAQLGSDIAMVLDECVEHPATHTRASDSLERTVRWGPRTLDLDLIWFDDLELESSRLTLPHPRAHEREFVLLLVRGDHSLNEIKAQKVIGAFRFAGEKEILEALHCKAGYIGPVGAKVKIVADRSVAALSDFVCGANEEGFHLTGVNFGRDLEEPQLADIRNVVAGDPSPDGKGTLEIARGIEVGHFF